MADNRPELPEGLFYGDVIPKSDEGITYGAPIGSAEETLTSKLGERYDYLQRKTEQFQNLAGDPVDGISPMEMDLARTGTIAGSVFDTVGVGLSELGSFLAPVGEGALYILSSMTTDAAQDWLKAEIAEGKEKLITSKAAKDMLRAYQILDNTLEPDQKDTIGDIFNTLAATLPKGKLGAKISANGLRATKDSLRDRVLDQTNNAAKARDSELKLPKAMQNITNKDEEILSAVITVPTIAGLTIGKSASPDRIIGSLNSEIGKLGKKLNKVF